jgi:hypothetical protein
MQISGVSLALTWPCRLLFTQISLVPEPLLQAFPFPCTLGKVTVHPHCQACVFIYSSCGRWAFPTLLCSFPPTATLTSFPAPGCWACAPVPTRGSLARLACLFTVPGRIPFPQSFALSAPHPLSCMSLLLLLLITQFLVFSLGGGWSVQGSMLLWPRVVCGSTAYHEAHLVHVFPCRLGAGDCRLGAFLVSPFNVKWRFSAPAGGVEGSKLCLFSVIMPAKCFSSVSPRFHYMRLAFCFLPLAAILVSQFVFFNS